MIVETSDNRLFNVRDSGIVDIDHAWVGVEVKGANGGFVPKARAREILVRKAGCRIIDADFATLADFEAALMSTLPAA